MTFVTLWTWQRHSPSYPFPADYTVIFTDTKVRGRQIVKHDELPIELKTTGGGGTNFIDVMNVIREEFVKSDDSPHGVIFFTDLCTSAFGEDPGIPVLWLVHGGNTSPCRSVRSFIASRRRRSRRSGINENCL